MLELTLSFIVMLLCVYAIVEVGRYAMIRSMVSKAAEEGLNYAQKVNGLDLDIRSCADETCDDYVRYRSARAGVVRHAMKFLGLFLDPPSDVSSPNRLGSYRIVDSLNSYTATALPYEAEVLLLRPGESGIELYRNRVISHPTLCNPTDSNCPPSRPRIDSAMSWTEVLRNNPFVLVAGAIYRPVVNFPPFNFPPVYIESVAVGYREPKTSLRIPPDINFPIPPLIPPTSIPTASSTPSCPGDYCGGNCLPPCIPPDVRDYGTCGCTSCTPPNVVCPGNNTCVPPCPGAKILDIYTCQCHCTLAACFPGQTRDPDTCICGGCNLPCGAGVPDAYCAGCNCSGLPACPPPQVRDSSCTCVGSCPPGTSICGGVCKPDPVTCESRDPVTCEIKTDCASCGQIDCAGVCRTSTSLASITANCQAAGPGHSVNPATCACECVGSCGGCGHVVPTGTNNCECRSNPGISCGPLGNLVCNVDPAVNSCQCDCNGDCGLGIMSGAACGPCSCNCSAVDCHGGTNAGGGNVPCSCDCSGVTCPPGKTMRPADCSCS